MPENIQSVTFTLTVKTDRREVSKTCTSYREFADAIDELYEEDLCPFPIDMTDEDPEWWDYDDEFEETADPVAEIHPERTPGEG